MKHLVFAFAISSVVVGCGSPSENLSTTRYISWSDSSIQASTIAHSRAEALRICVEGRINQADLDRAFDWSARAVLTWLRILKTEDNLVTSNIEFTCQSEHLTINMRSGSGTSYASPSVTTIYTSRPYGTWTHEFGHAFTGLSDTYSGRQAGVCKRGQPESLMCWGAYGPRANMNDWSTLWPDDIAGAKRNYQVIHEEMTPPEWADEIDLEAPLDPEAPWPATEAYVLIGDHKLEVMESSEPTVIETDAKTATGRDL